MLITFPKYEKVIVSIGTKDHTAELILREHRVKSFRRNLVMRKGYSRTNTMHKVAKSEKVIINNFIELDATSKPIRKTSISFPHQFYFWQKSILLFRFWIEFLPVFSAFLPKILLPCSFWSFLCTPLRGSDISRC